MRLLPRYLQVLVMLVCCTACSSHHIPMQSSKNLLGHKERGKASYYAMKYQFRTTASGETFNNFSLTAAHKQLPFGTKVRVTNVNNGKSVVVKINDRGPFVKGRIIDLSRSAFAEIGSLKHGVIPVSIEVVP